MSIAARRLRAQHLSGPPFPSPVDAVRRLTAVQCQDYGGAKWALGQRTVGFGDADLDRLFDDGAILRTHVLRPTWHFVLPEDVRWLLRLSSPRIMQGLRGRHRQLELDAGVIARAKDAFANALSGDRYLTRQDLGEVLRRAGIIPGGQRLPHLLLCAELDGLIISGPRQGKQFTWALLDDRVPGGSDVDRDEAAASLAHRYFESHGPAQLQDFVWWSGLTTSDARAGMAMAGTALGHEQVDGRDYWFDPALPQEPADGLAHLLPNFDEYTVAYRDRSAAIHTDRRHRPGIFSYSGAMSSSILSNVLVVSGRVRGGWRRAPGRGSVRVLVRVLDRLDRAEARAVERVAERFGAFLDLPVELTVET